MNSTLLPPRNKTRRSPSGTERPTTFREPSHECRETRDGLCITVYVPGVDANGIEIEGRGPDLTVTARKPHALRVNFDAMHLEGVQRDYLLKLRLGSGFDFGTMAAEITRGVLTINLPRRARASLPRVA
jgi:HSP20 family molecular chaperone IbpA